MESLRWFRMYKSSYLRNFDYLTIRVGAGQTYALCFEPRIDVWLFGWGMTKTNNDDGSDTKLSFVIGGIESREYDYRFLGKTMGRFDFVTGNRHYHEFKFADYEIRPKKVKAGTKIHIRIRPTCDIPI